MSTEQVQKEVAAQVWNAFTRGGTMPPAAADGLDSMEAAYGVHVKIEALAAMPRAGWKVGMTNKAVRNLDTDEPATAPMFLPFCFESPAEVPIFPDHDANVECEFAFRFARGLPPRDEHYDYEEVLAAVDVLIAAIEIVGCRFEGSFGGLSTIHTVADLVAHIAFVSGPVTADWRELDLRSHSVSLVKNDKIEAEGTGANVLDGPLSVLEWTANHLSRLGLAISAGEIVTTGTCTGLVPVAPGDEIVADFGTLGRVDLRLIDP